MQFISLIIQSNFLFYNEAVYISSSYVDRFYDSKILEVVKVEHKGRIFFRLDSLPNEAINAIELPEMALIYQELYRANPDIKNPYIVRYLNTLEINFREVIRDCKPFIQTYSDHKLDSATVRRKALTHGIMHFAGPFLKKFPDRYDSVFKILNELNPDIELPLNSIQEFYTKCNELIRAGLPYGLIKDLKAPLDTS